MGHPPFFSPEAQIENQAFMGVSGGLNRLCHRDNGVLLMYNPLVINTRKVSSPYHLIYISYTTPTQLLFNSYCGGSWDGGGTGEGF